MSSFMDRVQSRLEFCRDKRGIAKGVLFQPDGSHLAQIEDLTEGELADVVLDATGSNKSMSASLAYAAFTGRIVFVGITTDEVSFPHAPVFHRREQTLLASRNALPADFDNIISIIEAGKIDTNVWITHRLTINEVPEKFAQFTDPSLGAIKALIAVNH